MWGGSKRMACDQTMTSTTTQKGNVGRVKEEGRRSNSDQHHHTERQCGEGQRGGSVIKQRSAPPHEKAMWGGSKRRVGNQTAISTTTQKGNVGRVKEEGRRSAPPHRKAMWGGSKRMVGDQTMTSTTTQKGNVWRVKEEGRRSNSDQYLHTARQCGEGQRGGSAISTTTQKGNVWRVKEEGRRSNSDQYLHTARQCGEGQRGGSVIKQRSAPPHRKAMWGGSKRRVGDQTAISTTTQKGNVGRVKEEGRLSNSDQHHHTERQCGEGQRGGPAIKQRSAPPHRKAMWGGSKRRAGDQTMTSTTTQKGNVRRVKEEGRRSNND